MYIHGVRSYYNYIFTHYNYNMYNCFMLFFLGGLGGGPETSHLDEGGIICHEGRTFLSWWLDIVSWGRHLISRGEAFSPGTRCWWGQLDNTIKPKAFP